MEPEKPSEIKRKVELSGGDMLRIMLALGAYSVQLRRAAEKEALPEVKVIKQRELSLIEALRLRFARQDQFVT